MKRREMALTTGSGRALALEAGTGASTTVAANTIALALARIAPMLTGFAFWSLAALSIPPAALGLGATLVSAVLLVVQLGLLGVGPATVTMLPRAGGSSHDLVTTSLVTVTGGVLAVATATIAVTWWVGGPLRGAWSQSAIVLAFLAAALLATLAYQLDHVAIAVGRSYQALARSAAQGIVQLATLAGLLLLGGRGAALLPAAVAAGALASTGLGGAQLIGRGWRPRRIASSDARALARQGMPHHLLSVADRAPGYMLPLVVSAALSTTASASWYLAWMLCTAVFFVPQAAGYSLQAHLAAEQETGAALRRTLALSLALTLAAVAALVVIGPLVLDALGETYGQGSHLLAIMGPGLLLAALTQIYYGICRARGALGEATAVAMAAALVLLLPASLAATAHGLGGLAWLWLAGQAVAAALAGARLWSLTRSSAPVNAGTRASRVAGSPSPRPAGQGRLTAALAVAAAIESPRVRWRLSNQ